IHIFKHICLKMSTALISEYLETHQGRDKFLKTLSYATKFATLGIFSNETEKKLKIFSSQISECRMILRLLDDIPTIHYAMTYGWGKEESDWLIKCAELMQILVDIIFGPIEHIFWAGKHKLIKINIEAWDNALTWFWIISLQLSLLKVVLKSITKLRWNESLTCIRLILDMCYAVSYLPSGIFWGGKLKTWHVGALGTLSSLIGLYQALSQRAKHKSS
ncbi:unnamed protein product, partial [Heterotrigona itama]